MTADSALVEQFKIVPDRRSLMPMNVSDVQEIAAVIFCSILVFLGVAAFVSSSFLIFPMFSSGGMVVT